MHGYKWPINCTRTRTVGDLVAAAVKEAPPIEHKVKVWLPCSGTQTRARGPATAETIPCTTKTYLQTPRAPDASTCARCPPPEFAPPAWGDDYTARAVSIGALNEDALEQPMRHCGAGKGQLSRFVGHACAHQICM